MQDKRRSHVLHKRKEGEIDTLAQLEEFFSKLAGGTDAILFSTLNRDGMDTAR